MSVWGGGLTTCWMVRIGVWNCRNRSGKQAARHRHRRGRRRWGRRGAGAGRPPAPPAAGPTRRRHFDRGLLLGGGRRDVDRLAAGLDRGDDVRHGSGLVVGELHQTAGGRGHAVKLRDVVERRLREAQQRRREEEVVGELLARLAQLRQVGDDAGLFSFSSACKSAMLTVALRRRARRHGRTRRRLPGPACVLGRPSWSRVGRGSAVVTPATRVTRMSVPTVWSGARTSSWSRSRPCDTPMMPMTRPTPSARPRAVRIVRPSRRRSSRAIYVRWNTVVSDDYRVVHPL